MQPLLRRASSDPFVAQLVAEGAARLVRQPGQRDSGVIGAGGVDDQVPRPYRRSIGPCDTSVCCTRVRGTWVTLRHSIPRRNRRPS